FGVLVPASPLGEGETSGVELYDSGIGYAVPLEDILAKLPQLKEGKDLRRGLLGITPQGTDQYGKQPVIGAVQPDSGAARAGIQPGDKVVEIDGKPTPNYSTLQHVLGPKYAGETVKAKVPPTMVAVKTAAQLSSILARLSPASEIQIELKRKDGGKVETVSAKLGTVPDTLPEKLPQPSSLGGAGEKPKEEKKDEKKPPGAGREADVFRAVVLQEKKEEPKKDADEKKEKVETGLLKRTNEALGREYWVFVPDNYDPKVSHGLIV